MPDLPAIDTSLDAPLPEVPPDSPVVPYRTSATDPNGQVRTTVGYGARARPPIQPPEGFGGGVGMPSLDQTYQAAFSKLPVDEAVKAVEAAVRYQGLRGYQRDLASGANAAQAFAKWGPMLFRQATGIPEAIDRSVPTPITPQQLIQNRMAQQRLELSQAAAKSKIDAAKNKMHVLSSGEVLQETGDPENPVKVVKPRDVTATADKDIDYQIKAQNLMGLKPTELPSDPSYQQRTNLAAQIIKRHPIKTATAEPANPAQTQAASPFKEGQTIRNKKDGKLYKIVNGQPVQVKE